GSLQPLLRNIRLNQLSPDDKTFVVIERETQNVQLGDVKSSAILHRLAVTARREAGADRILFLPDGATLAVVHHFRTAKDDKSKEDVHRKEVQFWDLATGKRLDKTWAIPPSDRVEDYRLALSPDGDVLYLPQDRKNIRRYRWRTGEELEPLSLA